MFTRTTAINKIRKLEKRIKIIQGGTSAGKTFGILPVIIDKAIKQPNLEVSVVAESIPHLRRGALRDFEKIMKWTNRFVDDRFNKTLLKYEFSNGSFIEFFSADDASKLRGARRDVLYINECNNVTFESYNELAIRTRKEIFLDFNPSNEFWVHTELKDEPDSDFLILTYLDNEALDQSIVDQIEKNREKAATSNYWANWWKVYGEGQLGMLEGVVLNNWQLIDKVPTEARLLGIGLDFGYTNDPTAIVEVYNWNGKRIVNELVYQTGMLNSDIARMLPKKVIVYADSSEPKSIDEIRKHGIMIKGVTKGKDSINYGIDIMQQQDYLVTSNSTNLIKELRSYIWDTDKSGKRLNKPIDYNNHCFVGDTLITTINGQVKIKDIQVGDLVLTSNGYRKVLKRWDNGLKQVNKYSMQFETKTVYLSCTNEHLFKTVKKWKQVSQLNTNDTLFLYNYSTEKNTGYIQMKNILVGVLKDFIQKFGNITMEIYQKVIMCIMLMATPIIMIFQILTLFLRHFIYGLKVKSDLKIILNGQKIFTQKVLKKQRSGINLQKVENGIQNTERNAGLIENIKNWFVKFVVKNTKQDMEGFQNTAIQTAKLLRLDVEEKDCQLVYDLFVEETHEYFANGILVHNCIDSLRYHEMETIGINSNYGKYNVR